MKKTETKATTNAAVNNGNWSSTTPVVPMHYMHVEIEWLEKALGTSPNNQDILAQYIASKAPDAPSREQEIAAIGEQEVIDQQTLVYPKGKFVKDKKTGRYIDILDTNIKLSAEEDDKGSVTYTIGADGEENDGVYEDNVPYYYNYQIRGFFKDSCGLLNRAEAVDEDGKKIADGTESAKLKAYKKVIDGGIFVFPRRIAIEIPEFSLADDGFTMVPSYDENGRLPVLSRPLRTSGPTGERTAIASSEVIPAGSRIRFTIGMTSLKFKPAVIEWLNYAVVHGISGWRNSGLGICRWREIQADYTPFETIEG